MLFLKTLRLSDFRIFLSILFYSIAVEGKKDFFKKSCLTLKEGTISTYLVKYDLLDTGMTSFDEMSYYMLCHI